MESKSTESTLIKRDGSVSYSKTPLETTVKRLNPSRIRRRKMEFAELIRTPKLDRVVLHRPLCASVEGTLCITSHHLIFSSRRQGNEELWLLHRMVDSVERRIGALSGSLFLKCKDFRILQLDITGVEQCHNVANSIECLSTLDNVKVFYPFFHRALFDIMEDGWSAFTIEHDFARIKLLSDEWRISTVNKDYSVCASYPDRVIVPKSIEDSVLVGSASFRQSGRFPVLSYLHKRVKTALLRCGQPMVGTAMRRSRDDEKLLDSLLTSGKKGFIIDTRTQNVAQLSRTRGGGFEPEMHYPMWRRLHKPIERYHVLLDSLSKLVEAVSDTGVSMDKWLSRLESSGWLGHIKDVLTCACFVAQCLDQDETSVVVHGTEGMDGTLLACSIAQVILDPDCRTVRGFEALVEREWLQAGHPFLLRCQHGAFAPAGTHTKDQSPTFFMFLDCVFQIHQQFACSFEFSENFLIMLFEHSYCSSFGTFLSNSERDKKELRLPTKTVSLWSYVNRPEVLPTLLNPMYDPNNSVIWPSVAPQSLVLWPGVFLRWVYNQRPQQEAWVTISEIRDRDKELRSKAIRLRRQLLELEQEAVVQGLLQDSLCLLE
ncbi:myotubularin-related protein 9 isoform X3 [Ixodes scapularis]|uniref:myotubularin-related protein 9 isoform X3 n=1 Tax=Ixodes scapularis TaxID=6945 RepID=UPI001A9D8555|nr:myotubularin-related protein 9 isoform X3 [Ixodes scapularis]